MKGVILKADTCVRQIRGHGFLIIREFTIRHENQLFFVCWGMYSSLEPFIPDVRSIFPFFTDHAILIPVSQWGRIESLSTIGSVPRENRMSYRPLNDPTGRYLISQFTYRDDYENNMRLVYDTLEIKNGGYHGVEEILEEYAFKKVEGR